MQNPIDTVLIIGRPGSGKGTQAKLLSEKLGWIRLSTGDRIKEIRDGYEPFSPRVREMYDKGTLLPDWFADYLLESSLLDLDNHVGVVAEGFGRTKSQAEHFVEIIDWLGRDLMVFNLEVSEDEALRRMLDRAKTQDRPDSNEEEKVRDRFRAFNASTGPALEYFREKGLVVDIDGELTPEGVAEAIEEALKK
ncbi:MAG TPA: nucleoside monophosphate kinase [Candidatus Paceibacterota bacterium]|nr:nucleoside monophosphate kinase [Candidatus Paceibacterota bacterium]